jgi:hypothetical protein
MLLTVCRVTLLEKNRLPTGRSKAAEGVEALNEGFPIHVDERVVETARLKSERLAQILLPLTCEFYRRQLSLLRWRGWMFSGLTVAGRAPPVR